MQALNNATTQSAYVPAATLEGAASVRVSIFVANAAVYYQLKVQSTPSLADSAWEWGPEIFCPPSFQNLTRLTTGVRFRSANSAAPAQVTAQLLTALDVG